MFQCLLLSKAGMSVSSLAALLSAFPLAMPDRLSPPSLGCLCHLCPGPHPLLAPVTILSLHPHLYSPGLFASAHKHATQFLMSSKRLSLYFLTTPSYHPVYLLPFISQNSSYLPLAFSPTILSVLFSGLRFCLITNGSCQGHHQPVLPNVWSLLFFSLLYPFFFFFINPQPKDIFH